MVDPISAVCAAGLISVVKVLADGAVGTTVGGIIGNRADWAFCRLMRATSEHFLNNARLPENQDLLLGMIDAHQRSIAYVAETISSQARDARERMIADKIVKIAKRPMSFDFGEGAWLMPLITPLIASPGEDETGIRGARMIDAACESLVAWFEQETGETLPENLRRLFAVSAPNGRAPWQDIFRLYLTEAIKTNPRFERIYLASNVAEIAGLTITIQSVVIELEKGLEGLKAQLGTVATDVKQVLEIQAAQGDQINSLLKLFGESPLAAKARKANVDARAFVLLARKINLEVDDESQALSELNRAVEELLKIKATAEHGANLDALVDQAMKRIAEQSLRGEFDSAAAEAAKAFADWERREAEQRAVQRQSGLTLIKANIQQHLLRRDSVSTADWIERRITLERDGEPADAPSLLLETEIWYDCGRDRGLNFDLAVAIALSHRAVALSPADDKGAAMAWLGNALGTLSQRESGTQRLLEAVDAYREALKEYTRERVPLDWAATQNNLGATLRTLGQRESGTQRLLEAVDAYRKALKEFTRERVPLDWAMTQNNLGLALWTLGERENGTQRLLEAVDAYREALKERTRERVPLDWAITQNNLGLALWTLGERENGTQRLLEAVDAYREALKERTRERVPLDWAMTQSNLGAALSTLGQRENGTQRLDEAVDAFREALKERTRERVPLDWARTQNNLGAALSTLGQRENGTQRLDEAVDAFREALKECTRERVPLDWAMTQNNLGSTLRALGQRESGTQRQFDAIEAYREALKEFTRERVPYYWELTQKNLQLAKEALTLTRQAET